MTPRTARRAAVIAAALLLAACGGGAKTFAANGMTFRYPGDWKTFKDVNFRATTGSNELSSATIGIDKVNIVTVSTYRLNVSLGASNLSRYRDEIRTDVEQLAQRAGGRVLSGPAEITVRGLPGYRFQITAQTATGASVESRLLLLFKGTTEYFFNCQHQPSKASAIEQGCDTIQQSFKLSG